MSREFKSCGKFAFIRLLLARLENLALQSDSEWFH